MIAKRLPRRIAANIAKLPELVRKAGVFSSSLPISTPNDDQKKRPKADTRLGSTRIATKVRTRKEPQEWPLRLRRDAPRLSAHATVIHIVGDLFAHLCQFAEFLFGDSVVGLCS
jgi:hypothetical protein